ncbi:MAG: hypothetical protein ACFFFK_05635 [Candidatus Thorarchaeota archaeon]
MRMRKSSLGFTIVIMLTIIGTIADITPVSATVPEDLRLVYDFDSQTLAVNVSHYSPSVKNHYIETIEILKNDVFLMNTTYENQSVSWGVYDTFSVSAVVDDNLTVTAFCSKGYSLTTWLIVTSGTSTNPPPTETTTAPTTEPSDNGDPPGALSGLGPAVAASVAVVIVFIIILGWLNPERVPDVFKKLGSRIQSGLSWLGDKLKATFLWLKASLGTVYQQIKARVPSK